ncbi:unnamed protein product [Brachionus calyciflorus]|uniref:Uncharacterized protein n=1 Tax=Brachionus calyciflorus TaxID=104777 RepID=A0A813M9Y6_9BILA|nr:unnamed protein product [Brachionus calyciflorus]
MAENNLDFERDELKSENFKLTNKIENLRSQIQWLEEIISQIEKDLQTQTKKADDLSKINKELNKKLLFYKRQIETKDFEIQSNQHKDLIGNNLNLTQKLKESLNLLSNKENQLNDLNFYLDESKKETYKLKNELLEHKKLNSSVKALNSKLDKINSQELEIENEYLQEKCFQLENETKLLKEKSIERKFMYPNISKAENEQFNTTFTPLATKTSSFEKNNSNESQIDNLILAYQISNSLNNSTINASPFLFEKFETNFKTKDKEKCEYEALLDLLQDFLVLIESLKNNFDETLNQETIEPKLRDANNNEQKIQECKQLNQNYVINKLYKYLMKQSNDEICLKENLQKLIDQSRTLWKNYRLILNSIEGNDNSKDGHKSLNLSDCFTFTSDYFLISTPDSNESQCDKTLLEFDIEEVPFNEYQQKSTPCSLKKRKMVKKSLSSSSSSLPLSVFNNQNSIESIKKCDEFKPSEISNLKIMSDLSSTKISVSVDSKQSYFCSSHVLRRSINFKIIKTLIFLLLIVFFLFIIGYSLVYFLVIQDDSPVRKLIFLLINSIEIKNLSDSMRPF